MSSLFYRFRLGLGALILLGAGCAAPSAHFGSGVDQIPLTATSSQVFPSTTTPLTGTIEAWRGTFLDGTRQSALWLVTQQSKAEPTAIRGRFHELGSMREGQIVQLARLENGFTFALNWGLEEGEQGVATTTEVRMANGDRQLKGEMTMGSTTHTFTLHRDFSLPELFLVQVATSTSDGVNTRCEFDVSYPQLAQVLGVSEGQISAINTQIAQYVQDGPEPLTEVAGKFIHTCETEIKDELDNFPDMSDGRGTPSYRQVLQSEIAFANKQVLSTLLLSFTYSGGAHGNYGYDALNFAIASGTQLTLKDLVRTEKLQILINRMAAKLLVQSKDLLFEKEVPVFERLATDKTEMTPVEQETKFNQAHDWYLTDKGITFFFNPYEISPYAAGVQEVALPFSIWKDLATPFSTTLFNERK